MFDFFVVLVFFIAIFLYCTLFCLYMSERIPSLVQCVCLLGEFDNYDSDDDDDNDENVCDNVVGEMCEFVVGRCFW